MNNELKGVGGMARQAIIERSVDTIESNISANNSNVKLVLDRDFDSNNIYIIRHKYTRIMVNANSGSIRLPENPRYDTYYVNMDSQDFILIYTTGTTASLVGGGNGVYLFGDKSYKLSPMPKNGGGFLWAIEEMTKSDDNSSPFDTIATKEELNSSYPYAKVGYKIFYGNAIGGPVIVEKVNHSGDWASYPVELIA